ncbi:MAG: orotidine-5'-phosphate decarboxylase, partial [Ignavibacteria bacterium]|nr:orotidine-5'-phosphate decarboxylase [Ignavibacteria bacterium]
IIDATADLACAYKINLAFFEAHGVSGLRSMEQVLQRIPSGVLSIGDGKRGDIGNSAAMYARGLFRDFGFDAVTVSPYMGEDSVLPFLANRSKGAFVLALTSNKGAADFQYLRSGKKRLYQHVVARAESWNGKRNCGLVVGATKPSELRRIRTMVPTMPILIPGIGAQGGDLRSSVRYGCTAKGDLALLNVGRTILYASSGKNFDAAARSSAEQVRDEINHHRKLRFKRS